MQKIQKWKEDNWRIELFYLWIPSAIFSAKRVEYRVKQGGHDIPKDAISRRYPRSVANLFEYAKVCDKVTCYDNSEQIPDLIFSQQADKKAILNEVKFNKLMEIAQL